MDEVLTRAMAKDPADRYLSAGDLGRAVLAAADNSRVSRAERNVAQGDAAPAEVTHVPAVDRRQSTPAGTETAPREPAVAGRSRRLMFVGAGAGLAGIALLVVLLVGGGDKGTGSGGVTVAPPGQKVVAQRQVSSGRSTRYTVALSVPRDSPGGAAAAVPLTMSLLGAQGSGPLRVIERKQLPADPYRFANNSYVSQFQLDGSKDGYGNLGMSWYVHPGDPSTMTCYSTLSLGGIQLDGCG
jgi:hypothetical protein